MAITWPAKNNFATGDVLTAAQMNAIGDDLNDIYNQTAGGGWRFAGKNKIINGDFGVWQRGTSFTVATGSTTTYTADRFTSFNNGSANVTVSQQAFTVGQTDVPNNPTYFIRTTGGTGSNYVSDITQRIENVNTFAGQTVTVSFYAKASSSQAFSVFLSQNFGSGGSAQVDNTLTMSASSFTTSWVKYTGTITLPSISGKTVGTGNYLELRIRNSATSSGTTWDLAMVQVEAGSVATPFTTATGTVQGELAACQRYYFRNTGGDAYHMYGFGYASSTTQVNALINFPVQMRTTPTSLDYSSIYVEDYTGSVTSTAGTPALLNTGTLTARISITGMSGFTQGRICSVLSNNNASGYLGFNAEL